MSFDENALERIAAAIEDVRLDAIVVGNAGAILHGAPVLTEDVDLLLRDTPRNRQKLETFAQAIGGSRPTPISELSRVLRIHALVPVDILFNEISGGLRFESVKTRSRRIPVGKHALCVASLRDIIRSKEATKRPKDIASLPILRDTLRVEEAEKKIESKAHRYRGETEREKK